MDETKEILLAVLSRLDTMGADIKGLTVRMASLEDRMSGLETRMGGLEDRMGRVEAGLSEMGTSLAEFRSETNTSFGRLEGKLGHLAEKWMEHDQEIYQLKRRS